MLNRLDSAESDYAWSRMLNGVDAAAESEIILTKHDAKRFDSA